MYVCIDGLNHDVLDMQKTMYTLTVYLFIIISFKFYN